MKMFVFGEAGRNSLERPLEAEGVARKDVESKLKVLWEMRRRSSEGER